tara:strand:+ start:583 stop:828 length:246 start_codon:yes stop_codon:yes gene_type:complete
MRNPFTIQVLSSMLQALCNQALGVLEPMLLILFLPLLLTLLPPFPPNSFQIFQTEVSVFNSTGVAREVGPSPKILDHFGLQ